ncbi:MAG: TIGR02996 domain-containing protein [Bacteroidales bacterium]|nr:TIGR02996 domain-containing protein [Bacteroidales bacterium]
MISGEATLLGEIILTPEDDTPRLAYAGWLEKHWQVDRAIYVRWQVHGDAWFNNNPELWQLPAGISRLSFAATRHKLAEMDRLTVAGVASFAAGMPPQLANYFRQPSHYHRGMLELVGGDAAELSRDLPELIRVTPIQTVTVHDGMSALPAVLQLQELSRLRCLRLITPRGRSQTREFLAALTACPAIPGLRYVIDSCDRSFHHRICGGDDTEKVVDRLTLEEWSLLRDWCPDIYRGWE